jgi:hypothetical protein
MSLPAHAYHLADAGNWPAIRREGLLSTAALIARAELDARAAAPFASYRDGGRQLPCGALIRDQRPMPPSALARCLDAGLAPQDWYDLVNAKVFFWLDDDRLARHMAACARRPQVVMVIDLDRLLARHGARAYLTPFNVGNARRRAAPRGARSFVPLTAWRATRWQGEALPGQAPRAASHPPAELAIEHGVPDIMTYLVEARSLAGPPTAR